MVEQRLRFKINIKISNYLIGEGADMSWIEEHGRINTTRNNY